MQQQSTTPATVFTFGLYEVNPRDRLLTKGGTRIRLQGQPFQILALLLERPGQLVTREQIRAALWPDNTFVEFDDSLNNAIGKLRAALGDTAESPRFIETVPRSGYRFVAPVATRELPHVTRNGFTAHETTDTPTNDVLVSKWSPNSSSTSVFPRLGIAAALVLLITAGAFAWRHYHLRRSTSAAIQPVIVLAEFENHTSDPVFNTALKQAAGVALRQSPYSRLLSDQNIRETLRMMGRPEQSPLSTEVALEVCRRAAARFTVAGSVSNVGNKFLVGLNAFDCASGDSVAHEQLQANDKKDVIAVLGKAIEDVRAKAGESPVSIERFNAPLERATTPSLEALEALSIGMQTWDTKGDAASIPLLKHAVELDPNFATAYAALGTVYHNMGESEISANYMAKAYELRDRLAEIERLNIEARYHLYVTGNLEEAAAAYERTLQIYPQISAARTNLSNIYATLGRFQKSAEVGQAALRDAPGRASNYGNLASSYVSLNRIPEAEQVLAQAQSRGLTSDNILMMNYIIGFLHNDSAAMQKAVDQAAKTPDTNALFAQIQSNTEGYYGRYKSGRALTLRAAKESAAFGARQQASSYLNETALREAEVGNFSEATKLATDALKTTQDNSTRMVAALVFARVGKPDRAEQLVSQITTNSHSQTNLQGYWLPTIHGAIALSRHQPAQAVEFLKPAAPNEMGNGGEMEVSTLYPAYLRGQAYREIGDTNKSAVEFQKLLQNPGMTANFPLGSLAHLQLARTFAAHGDKVAARNSYESFFYLWREADPDIPVLIAARAEYTDLQK